MARKKTKKNGAVEKKLVGVADTVIAAAERSKDPTLSIPVRSLANVTFDEKRGMIEMGRRKQARSFFNVGIGKKVMHTGLRHRRAGVHPNHEMHGGLRSPGRERHPVEPPFGR